MKWLPLAAALVASALLFPGCGGSSATVILSQQAPVLRSVRTTPEDLRFNFGGGTIVLRAVVESARPLRSVTAERRLLDSPNPSAKLYPLVPVDGKANEYQASIDVPPNTSVSGQPARYRLTVTAEDSSGVVSDRWESEIRVAPPDSLGLPATPFSG